MISELSQNRLFIKRKLVIKETKLIYQSSKFGHDVDINIPYEELTLHKESHKLNFQYGLIIMGVTVLITIASFSWRNDKDYDPDAWIIFLVSFIAASLYYFLFKENVWRIKLQNYTYIFVNKKLPVESDVDSFIISLFNQRNKYLRETYINLNRNISYELQFKNLQWLKRIEVISAEEFDINLKQLDALFASKKIGF
jgi:hypothetical protein